MSEQEPNQLIELDVQARAGGVLQTVAGGLPAVRAVQPPAPKADRHPLRKLLLVGASVLALAGAAHFGREYWTVGRFQVSTDDAYVKADSTTIAPKVSGYIASVLVGDNEPVKTGEVLARIDDRDFRVALNQANADLEAAKAAVSTKLAAITAQQSVIDAAQATIAVDQATLTFAEQDDKRYAQLASNGYGSVQNAQQAASRLAEAAPRSPATTLHCRTRRSSSMSSRPNSPRRRRRFPVMRHCGIRVSSISRIRR
jgi:multidrug resistance efflux pump